MNGGMTYKDLDLLKAKARAFDEALEYLSGRSDNEQSVKVEAILRKAITPEVIR
jgi:hypothetical protein